MYTAYGTATLTGCTVVGNSAYRRRRRADFGRHGHAEPTAPSMTTAASTTSVPEALRPPSGTTSLSNCTVSGNSSLAPGGSGGGVQTAYGTTTLTNCTISDNSVAFNGGGLASYGATNTLTNCTVSGNSSAGSGGGLADGFGIPNSTIVLTNCTLSGNYAYRAGGGLSNLMGNTATLTGCTVSGNIADSGGGIYSQGTLNIASSSITKNQATLPGWRHQHDRRHRDDHRSRSSTRTRSTRPAWPWAAGSTAPIPSCRSPAAPSTATRPTAPSAMGGGISAYSSVLSLTGTTIDADQANGATAYGGGLYALYSAVTASNCTVVGNQANGTAIGEGGGIYGSSSTFSLVATKVSGNTATTGYNNYYSG